MSSISKAPTDSTEESGWTTYFDYFFNNSNNDDDDDDTNNNHKCSSVSSSTSSSLLSDATSLVNKNVLSHNQHVGIAKEFSLDRNGKTGSSFKKRKNTVDRSLEDTATSHLNCLKEKGNTSGQKELSLNGKDSDCTELKKIGVCVVPL
ncbi:hypothetical protein MtrunA17_Chr4g0041781 [Medicago truncatula]|uniref:Uncharacterized protein n=1 Tax=Medicago truncatula TaxID=3880 RepID=G7JDV3_MEDTR|nr:uncharacterized protein LOC11444629 [Medicago truncatula]AES89848.1 hypothetical protein MTR_4g080780 [Medicago truncatula]RHN61914.1 hypothetical protein MtrunA17_Chr4g0041781 [Medicago truncatula]